MLTLKKFDITHLRCDSAIAIIGPRQSGKTFLVKDILRQKAIPKGIIFCGPSDVGHYSDFRLTTEYKPEIIKKIRKHLLSEMRLETGRHCDFRNFIVIDDCIDGEIMDQDREIRYMLMNGRLFWTNFILTMQHPVIFSPCTLSCIDYVFIFPDDNPANRDNLYKWYADCFGSYHEFCQTLDRIGKYECLVIDNTKFNPKFEDHVFWYRSNVQ